MLGSTIMVDADTPALEPVITSIDTTVDILDMDIVHIDITGEDTTDIVCRGVTTHPIAKADIENLPCQLCL